MTHHPATDPAPQRLLVVDIDPEYEGQLSLETGPIVFVQLPALELCARLRAFAPKADWVVVAGSKGYSAFGWRGASGPGDEGHTVAKLARHGVSTALALWPDHWDEGVTLVRYEGGTISSQEEEDAPKALASKLGVKIFVR